MVRPRAFGAIVSMVRRAFVIRHAYHKHLKVCVYYQPPQIYYMSKARFKHAVAANGMIIGATFRCSIVIVNSDSAADGQELFVPSKLRDTQIHQVFVDQTGNHIVVSLSDGANWYKSMSGFIKLSHWNDAVRRFNLFLIG